MTRPPAATRTPSSQPCASTASWSRLAPVQEIAPGIHHWTAHHPDINLRVSSYYVEPAGLLIDPLEPEDGLELFDSLDLPPQQIVLTIGVHWRHSDRFRDRYGAT